MSLEIAKPDNWQDFERISARLCEKIYKTRNIHRYGRQGQRQNGVDIMIESEEGIEGIQCKHVEKLTFSEIDEEIEKAEKFIPALKSFKFYTTLKRDTTIQSYIAGKSQEYRAKNLFDIDILSWEDIAEKLQETKNYDILEDFYPKLFYADVNISNMLDIAFENFKDNNYVKVENLLNILNQTEIHFNNKNATKFHILKGKYNELCNQYKDAGKEYIKAYRYQPDNPKLKFYNALGLYFMGEIEESKEICKDLLKENCDENTYSLSVLLNNMPEDEIIDEFKSSNEVLYSLALNSYKQKDYSNSSKLIDKIKFGNDVKKSINYCMIKLAKYHHEDFIFNMDYLNDPKFKHIEDILQNSMDSIPDKILTNYLNQFYKLLHLNYKLNHNNQLNTNIERGLKVDPENSNILHFKAILLNENGDKYGAINILKDIIFVLPESFRYLSLILIEKKDYKEIINLGKKLLSKLNDDSEDYLFCCDVLVDAYLNENQKIEAEKIVDSMEEIPYKNLLKSKLSENLSEKHQYLNHCLENIDSFESHHKLILAIECSNIGLFKKAISIYESCLNSEIYSKYLEDLMYCYYCNNDYVKIIKISEYFILKNEFHPYFLELEMEAYLKINDYEKALSLIKIYQKEVGDNFKIEIANAKINLILKNYDEVDLFLNKDYSVKNLQINQCIDLYELYKSRGCHTRKMLDLLYEIRLYNYKNYDWIHEWYVAEILQLNPDLKEPEYVDYETGISVKFINNSQDLFLLKTGKPQFKLNELNNFDALINHKIGDIVEIDRFGSEVEILDIYNKYKFAFDESFKNIDFNNTKVLKQIPIGDSVESIFQMVKDRSDFILNLSNYYRNHLIRISVFSKFSGKDIYDTYFYLRSIGLNSFTHEEKINNNSNVLVLDITSLFTIHSLKIEELIKENYNLFVSHKTLYELDKILERTKHYNNQESMTVFEDEGEFYRGVTNNENKISDITKIIKWTTLNCKTQPSKKLFELTDAQYKIINDLKEYNSEDVLLAIDNKILVSDDLASKKIFKEKFNIETCGTLNLIENLFNNKKIKKEKFEELISQLYAWNYRDVPISAELIINMIKKGDYGVLIRFLIRSNDYSNFETMAKHLILNLDKNDCVEHICYQMINNTLFNQKFKNCRIT